MATRPLTPFTLLVVCALLSTVAFSASITAAQNLLVLLVFVTTGLAGIAVASQRGDATSAFASRIFGAASVVALMLYGGSLALGGVGSGVVIGNRSFALFAIIVIAWGVSGWRYGVRHARTLALLAALFTVLSLSRTAIAATLLIMCLVWLDPRTLRGRVRPIGAAAAGIAVAYLASVHVQALHDRIYTGDIQQVGGFAVNFTGRTDLWETTWQSFKTSPYFGHGVGSADTLITRVYGAGIGHPHNDYLRILHDYGVVGAALWIVGYCWLLQRTWRAWQHPAPAAAGRDRDAADPEARIHAAAFLALVGVALTMITDNVISYLSIMGPLGALVGLSLGLGVREREHPRESPGTDDAPAPLRPRGSGPSAPRAVIPSRR